MRYFLFAATIWSVASSSSGQTNPELDPSLGLAFPLAVDGDYVVCGEDVILNKEVVLKKGTILHVAFEPPTLEDVDVKRANAKVDLEKTFPRKIIKVDQSEMTYQQRALMSVMNKRAFKVKWKDPNQFRGWFHKKYAEQFFLVYQTDLDSDPVFAGLEYLDGLFLTAPDGKITVAGLIPDSRPAQCGIKAGEQIVSIAGKPFDKPVSEFYVTYLATKKGFAELGESMPMEVYNPETNETRTVQIQMPYSLSTNPFG